MTPKRSNPDIEALRRMGRLFVVGVMFFAALVLPWYLSHLHFSGIRKDVSELIREKGERFQHVYAYGSSGGYVGVTGYLRSNEEVEQLWRNIVERLGEEDANGFVRMGVTVYPDSIPIFEEWWAYADCEKLWNRHW